MSGKLQQLNGFPFPVYVSHGGEQRGRAIAERMRRTVAWLDETVGMPSIPALYVVGQHDWSEATDFPVYGMPHVGGGRVVTGQEPGPFWATVLDVITPDLSPQARHLLTETYGDPVDLGPFADLLVSHELGHVTHEGQHAAWDNPTGFWLKELAANLALQGYVTELEPETRPVLETVFEVAWAAPSTRWPIRELSRMSEAVETDGSNYVWMEWGLQVLARRLWRAAGASALRRVVGLLRGPAQTDESVLALLADLDPPVARAVRQWPHFEA